MMMNCGESFFASSTVTKAKVKLVFEMNLVLLDVLLVWSKQSIVKEGVGQ